MKEFSKKRESYKNTFFDLLKVGKYEPMGVIEKAKTKKIGAIIAYYNRTRKPKYFYQRTVKGMTRIYRGLNKN